MTTTKNLGIWMDHSNAHLMTFSNDSIETTVIESEFTHQVKESALGKGESHMHNKEQGQQSAYYQKLGDAIKDYETVLLFGPTDAKVELLNVLKEDHHFDKIEFVVKQADKMTENQEHAFVREHFYKD